MIRQGLAFQWLYYIWSPLLWPTVLEEGCIALSDTHSFLEVGVLG